MSFGSNMSEEQLKVLRERYKKQQQEKEEK